MNKVLTIAGFDPSAGAGILADIKTFQSFGVYGFGICTAVTVQNESAFLEAGWVDDIHIAAQLDCILEQHQFNVAKIGLVRNAASLRMITDRLLRSNERIKIIWDPVLHSSSGFTFHDEGSQFKELFDRFYLITPNVMEASVLGLVDNSECNVLLKGGHKGGSESEDELFLINGSRLVISGERIPGAEKHGSGCVLSAAIAACLAEGSGLPEACTTGKEYVTRFLVSNDTLLGYHLPYHEKA